MQHCRCWRLHSCHTTCCVCALLHKHFRCHIAPLHNPRCVAVRFQVEAALHSGRPRVGGLTVVVCGALNRLYMVEATCAAWVLPLAVTVVLPVLLLDAENTADADRRVAGTMLRPLMPFCPAYLCVSSAFVA